MCSYFFSRVNHVIILSLGFGDRGIGDSGEKRDLKTGLALA